MNFEVIESGPLSPEAIMAKDAALLANLDADSPSFIHFYEWNVPCLTHGYFTDPSLYLDLEALQHCGIQKAKRPTGGGIIFHLSDFAFSILIPAHHPNFSLNTLDNYAFINQKVAEAIACVFSSSLQPNLLAQELPCISKECHAFCMAKPTQYDLIINGKKVGGAAQRRTKQGLLHQASLSLCLPPIEVLQKVLKNQEKILEAMRQNSDYLLAEKASTYDLSIARNQLKKKLVHFSC